MRRISLLAAAALMLAGVVASAQSDAHQNARSNIVTRVVRASLHGIVLTDAEKAKLATVSKTYAPRFKAITDSTKSLVATVRAARASHDTAAARAARRSVVALRRSGVVVLRKSLLDIRTTLTPEHQAHFDANAVRVRRVIRQHVLNARPA